MSFLTLYILAFIIRSLKKKKKKKSRNGKRMIFARIRKFKNFTTEKSVFKRLNCCDKIISLYYDIIFNENAQLTYSIDFFILVAFNVNRFKRRKKYLRYGNITFNFSRSASIYAFVIKRRGEKKMQCY